MRSTPPPAGQPHNLGSPPGLVNRGPAKPTTPVRLSDLARLPGISASHLARPEHEVRGISADSRRAAPGTAFFALRGAQADGHRFLADAARAGAPALVFTDPAAFAAWRAAPPEGLQPKGLLLAREGRRTLAELAAAVYGDPSRRMTLLAVTGTNGKTTVTHLVAQMLAALGRPCALVGSVGLFRDPAAQAEGAGLTTPEAPELQAFLAGCLAQGVQAAAMEASSVGIEAHRTHALAFAGAAFTNLSQDHLDVHPDMDAYREAKFRLFTEHEAARAVINLDDPAGRLLLERIGAARPELPCRTFALGQGPSSGADLTAQDARWDAAGVAADWVCRGRAYPIRAPLLGAYNLSNLLCALGLLLAADVAPEDAAAVAPHAQGAPGRLERIPVPRGFTVVVDYAHSPGALEAVLGAVRPLTRGRLWIVFGCGGGRDRAKRPLMAAAAERLADRVVLTNDNPRHEAPGAILDETVQGLRDPKAAARIEPREEAIRHALDAARPGDLVLIAGKGHETYQDIGGVKHPFSDQAVVRAWAEGK